MLTLAINTASSKTEIALLKNGRLLGEKSWKSKSNEAEKLMPEIKNLFIKHGEKFDDIKNVLVIKGPGSFTGLRVGVAVANMIAYLNKCDLYSINTFDYWWLKNKDKANYELLIYAGMGGVYIKGKLIDIPEVNNYLKKHKIKKIFGEILDKQKKEIKCEFVNIKKSFGKTILKLDFKKLKKEHIVEPLYIKKPNITRRKKK